MPDPGGRQQIKLHALREGREYLIARYGPECAAEGSQVNRPAATLEEIAQKTSLVEGPSSECACPKPRQAEPAAAGAGAA